MVTLTRGPRLARAFRCPQCRQPWLPQRRLFTPSATILHNPVTERPIPESETDGKTSTATPQRPSRLSFIRSQKGSAGVSSRGGGGVKKPRLVLGQTPDKPIRTRFAPSPTGNLHLGSLRTALFNNLASVASKGGSFILRIEDTDQNRLVEGAEEKIVSDLKWLGLEWSEGPDCGGPHAPYRQSERLDIYKSHVQKLVDLGYAYRCFCTPEDLEKQRLERHDAGLPTAYPGTCRSVTASEAEQRAAAGEANVVRFRGDASGVLGFKDAIYGPFKKKEAEEDFVILKTDGYPTYHLANVVDDHLMEITHVIRGEEWLISTPKHLSLYKAFGWDLPTFAHLGLLVEPDGSKLSKRNKSGFVSEYRDKNYLSVPMQAWLANLGSSFRPDVREVPRTLSGVADALSFKFTKGGIKLNPEKLDDFEVKYHRAMLQSPQPDLTPHENAIIEGKILRPVWEKIQERTAQDQEVVPMLQSGETRMAYLRRMLDYLARGRYQRRDEMLRLVDGHPHYFWRIPDHIYQRGLSEYLHTGNINRILNVASAIKHITNPDFTGTNLSAELNKHLQEMGVTVAPEDLYRDHRFVGTGQRDIHSHDANAMFAILGREEWQVRGDVVVRLASALADGEEP